MTLSNRDRRILFVVGIHRSGTSALVAALSACGATTGSNMLEPMAGVNDDGFWEDKDIVELNECLLKEIGSEWYTLPTGFIKSTQSEEYRQRAKASIAKGFGLGSVEIIKDPRLCITLPFWLEICDELGIGYKVCVAERAQEEVARSLTKRDEFPLSYSRALVVAYHKTLVAVESQYGPFAHTNFNMLLEQTKACVDVVIDSAWNILSSDNVNFSDVINTKYRHQNVEDNQRVTLDDDLLVINELVRGFVRRGQLLTDLGIQHDTALDVISERDLQLKDLNEACNKLGKEHEHAISIVAERDMQLHELNSSHEQLGKEHEHAINVVVERDKQLSCLNNDHDKLGKEYELAANLVRERDAELKKLNEELNIHRSWWKKILYTFRRN